MAAKKATKPKRVGIYKGQYASIGVEGDVAKEIKAIDERSESLILTKPVPSTMKHATSVFRRSALRDKGIPRITPKRPNLRR